MVDRPATTGTPRSRRRAGLAAIGALCVAWVLIIQSLGWAQTSYFAFVKALGDGTPQIDRYHWETRDKSYTGGHFFSVKAPGLPVLLVPAWKLLEAVGAPGAAADAADAARRGGARQWTYHGLNVSAYGYDINRARQIKRTLEHQAPLVWALGLLGTVLPAVLLLLLVRRLVERRHPNMGTATALSLGAGTLLMPFAVNLFGHALAALVGFAAFALLLREREGPPRTALVALAGLVAGAAVLVEYPLAFAGAVIGVYAVTRGDVLAAGTGAVLRRAGAFGAGALAGAAPVAAYNLWAFGSVTTMSYDNAVDQQGFTGHATLGLNSGGFFGISVPHVRTALELLFSPRGIVALTPVVALGVAGIVLLYRRGRRADALTIGGVVLIFLIYDAGYWLPFGGGSPGPRFLVATLPFLALGIAETWRRAPATTLVLSSCGAIVMAAATLTYPLIGTGSLGQWWERIDRGVFQHTLLSLLGAGDGWLALIPVLLALAAAAVLGARATGPLAVSGDARLALGALAGWVLLVLAVAPALGERRVLRVGAPMGPTDHTALPWQIVLAATLAALLALGGALVAERRAAREAPLLPPDPGDQQRPAPDLARV